MADRRRTALITGSGRNIGKATALWLAADGFNIVVNGSSDRAACETVAAEAAALGVDSAVIMADVGDRAAARGMAAEAIERFGGVDVLVNNASLRPIDKFLECSDEAWDRVINVDLNAAVWLCKACLPGMVERGWGRIVNFAGMNAIHGYAGRAHVSVSKHGSWGLTKALAKEFAPNGITVNIISSGPIEPEAASAEEWEHLEETKTRVPMKRMGSPKEIAATIGWLVSDGGAFTTGQLLQINGGAQT